VILALWLLAASTAHAAFAGQNGKIAFESTFGTGASVNYEIYSMNSDGSARTRLTTASADDVDPAWSPDGREIAFSRYTNGALRIWVMNADGSDQRSLGVAGDQPSWAPDGSMLAFRCTSEICTANRDGTNLTNITHSIAADRSPAWSPDGMKIAFWTDRDPATPNVCCIKDIALMNPDGTSATLVTHDPTSDYDPSWSPDGTKILFVSDRAQGAAGGQLLHTMNPDGSDVTPVDSLHGYEPVYSPDGSKIAFGSSSGSGGDIFVASSDGSGVTDVTPLSSYEGSPDWQRLPVTSPPPSYDHPALASTLRVSLVPGHRQTISATQCGARGGSPSTHGAPLALAACDPPAYLPGTAAHLGPQSASFAQYSVVYGDTNAGNGDQANVTLAASLNDIRTTGGGDYDPNVSGPDLTLVTRLRISDSFNGGSQSDPATVQDFDYQIPIDCTPTAGPDGSACLLDTSADAITPDTIRENKASVLQVFRFRVNDSGVNGVRGDGDDRSFAAQGIYIP
jgi:TolB protein